MYQGPYGDQEPGQAYYEDVPPGHTQPYPPQPASLRLSEPAPPPRRAAPWLAVICCVVSIASLVLAAWVWSAQSSARQAAARQAAQIAQLRQALGKAQSSNARSISGLAGQVGDMNATVNGMAQFTDRCPSLFNDPNGQPRQYWVPCTDQKP
jgi:hypothetical protein